jgi:hypothetical protein
MSQVAGLGLCATCQHGRTVTSRKGSAFLFCRRSEQDTRYPKYPALPMVRCPGYEETRRGESPGTGSANI